MKNVGPMATEEHGQVSNGPPVHPLGIVQALERHIWQSKVMAERVQRRPVKAEDAVPAVPPELHGELARKGLLTADLAGLDAEDRKHARHQCRRSVERTDSTSVSKGRGGYEDGESGRTRAR